jgi:hypothetical protein
VLVEMGVAMPIACSSAASRRPRSFCFSVEGQVGGGRVRLGVDGDVAQEALGDGVVNVRGELTANRRAIAGKEARKKKSVIPGAALRRNDAISGRKRRFRRLP